MNDLVTRTYAQAVFALDGLAEGAESAFGNGSRRDRVVWVVVAIAIAVIAAVGLLTAWWLACRAIGKYPTFSVPAWGKAGSYRAWCN
ncbi:hypothetical protein NS220_10030 [Microbacterium testaceum]|uniref:Uncharacterized protein n=1 Tax=Microbacterium testaceum TaxID=2033 RepID=A0A147EXA6_MICTE|nr:hypothetical protein [Microbacterium testaceum]KTR94165.1 hypothetical protein NS220_10030 [Microbacterium testaceum]